MQRHADYTRDRLRLLAPTMRELIYPETRPLDQLLVAGPVTERISFDQAQQLTGFRPARMGEQFGPLWATYWFRARATVPAEWAGRRVDLLWESHSEATLWMGGRSIQGLNHDPAGFDQSGRPDAILREHARGGETVEFQIEMACNKKFGYENERRKLYRNISLYVLDRAEIALFDPLAWELYFDFSVLQALEAESARPDSDLDRCWAGLLLSELNRFANTYDPADRSTWSAAHAILKDLYRNHNATTVHELSAIGHAHIDTAWLWPLAETRRKCVRTFSTATTYMDHYPDYRFACSQAQQYAFVKEDNPDLFDRIRTKVKAGQFIPVGGTWVEPDCNIPSGESLVRQFLFGQRFFEKEFGRRCREFWNPDVFGYNGQLPQICNLAGITRFLTQKLSWNRFNKPHHHTFVWEGIDGSEVFTHFPPADTYNATASIEELRRNAARYKDHDRSRHSFMLFGFGDGGGGPTKEMIERLRRAKDLEGLPRTTMRTSEEFFDLLEKDCTDRVRLIGELYFEYHRGTYTSQAATKRGNRKSEQLLHDVEFLSSAVLMGQRHPAWDASREAPFTWPAAELERLWKLVLLNQFHDILPGSSIREVYEDAAAHYAEIERTGRRLRDEAVRRLAALIPPVEAGGRRWLAVNTLGVRRAEVAEAPDGTLVYVSAEPYGPAVAAEPPDRVTAAETADGFVLENARLRAVIARDGTVTSLLHRSSGREALAAPGNQLLIYRDEPTAWDAWDVDPQHLETEEPCPPAESVSLTASPLAAVIRFERRIGVRSTLRQEIVLRADSPRLEFHCEADWHEEHRMLKVAFPVQVRAMNATYEMQFGTVERPTHFNTSYDLARFEVPGHRFSDLSEHGFGVALLSESKYGWSTFGNTMRLSLLRSPKYPDPQADMGRHTFSYALLPHSGGWREAGVAAEAARFNQPVHFTEADSSAAGPEPGSLPVPSFASCDDPNLVLDTIKKAEDSDALILRLYETHGARGTARVRVAVPAGPVHTANILEDETGSTEVAEDGSIVVPYRPYQIITLKIGKIG